MQYPQVEFDEPEMKSGDRTEGLKEFYEKVVKKSKNSRINLGFWGPPFFQFEEQIIILQVYKKS